MSKKLKKNVPKLRFPKFEEDWAIKKLGDICDCIVPGRNKPKTFNGDIPWITTPDIENGKINILSTSLKISYEEARSIGSKVVPKGSVLMSCAGEIGITAITDCEIVINQQLHAFIPPHDVINKYFLFYGIQTQKKYIDSIATKTAVPYLNKNNCNSISIPLPSIAEQEKIASFLGAVDRRLTQLRRKQELLQTYKRGVMQKIFSQEIRFKGAIGSEFPDWERKKLGNISDVRDGTHESPKYYSTGKILITSKNLLLDGSIDFENIDFISELDYVNINKRSKVSTGDILFGMIGTIGNPVLLKSEGFAIKNVALIKEQKKLKNKFLIHYLKSSLIKKQFHEQNTGGTQKFIALGVIRSLEVFLPSLEEQEKIADFLTTIDRKIETLSRQIDQTEQFKKGLLQKMFV